LISSKTPLRPGGLACHVESMTIMQLGAYRSQTILTSTLHRRYSRHSEKHCNQSINQSIIKF